jgi:hypothetical protein
MASSFRSSRLPPAVQTAQPVPDFAFADTVIARDLDDAIPASGVVISDPRGGSHCVVPTPYGLSHPHEDVGAAALRVGPPTPRPRPHPIAPGPWARMRAEMRDLWSATASLEESHDAQGSIVYHGDPFVRAATVGRRVRTFFTFFEWDRADLLRAAWIGLAVFVVVATIGAVVLEAHSDRTSLLPAVDHVSAQH